MATLDPDGSLEALPFMPEMLQYCGKELTVAARADKTCDTIGASGNRRVRKTVHLEGARCDGSAHGDCQAGCLLFWREEWLERPGTPARARPARQEPARAGGPARADMRATLETLVAATRTHDPAGETAYRCQATDLLRFSSYLPSRDLRQYVLDVRTGNVRFRTLVKGLLVLAINKFQRFTVARLPHWLRIRGGIPFPFVQGTGTGERTPTVGLGAGDLVEVRSKTEIQATLAPDNRNRQMSFDPEMLPYCGRQARVQRQVRQIIDERTGHMIKLADCVVLENVVCQGTYHKFCPRAITPYWREAWLRRVPQPETLPSQADQPASTAEV